MRVSAMEKEMGVWSPKVNGNREVVPIRDSLGRGEVPGEKLNGSLATS